MPAKPSSSRWYPTISQLKDASATHRAFKQMLDQFYSLQDQHNALLKDHAALQAKVGEKQSGPPPGSGPSDTMLLGLHVAPVDVQTLANGATLKFNKSSGNFGFS